jgi:hypothetical protein
MRLEVDTGFPVCGSKMDKVEEEERGVAAALAGRAIAGRVGNRPVLLLLQFVFGGSSKITAAAFS